VSELEGRTAVVTGAAGGIGSAIAAALAGAGAAVALWDLDGAAAEKAAVGLARAVGVAVDITDRASVEAALAITERELGPVDILVNNAGIDKIEPFLTSEEPTWERIVAVNFLGTVRCCHVVAPGMVERGIGRIVNIASDAGRVGSSGEAVYSAAKGRVIAFTKTLAREMARHRINVNCVCPGPSETPLFQTEFAAGRPALADALKKAIPWGRLGRPDDVAGAVVFLASDEAEFITGQTLSVSGGLTMV
jgi:2-hydroxycyclohexanecarboxyl-CoA dehydrogenase